MITRRTMAHLVVPFLLVLLAGCQPIAQVSAKPAASVPGASAATVSGTHWPAPANPMQLAVDAGLVPEPNEHLEFHVHAHLDVFIDGVRTPVPAGIGINIEDPDVHTFDDPAGVEYGGITKACGQPCISPLHTHNGSGVIHTESATPKPNTLGQLFTEWAVALSDSCVGEYCSPKSIAVYVDGTLYSGDPRAIELSDRREIAIVIGTPPAQIPSIGDFSRA